MGSPHRLDWLGFTVIEPHVVTVYTPLSFLLDLNAEERSLLKMSFFKVATWWQTFTRKRQHSYFSMHASKSPKCTKLHPGQTRNFLISTVWKPRNRISCIKGSCLWYQLWGLFLPAPRCSVGRRDPPFPARDTFPLGPLVLTWWRQVPTGKAYRAVRV